MENIRLVLFKAATGCICTCVTKKTISFESVIYFFCLLGVICRKTPFFKVTGRGQRLVNSIDKAIMPELRGHVQTTWANEGEGACSNDHDT